MGHFHTDQVLKCNKDVMTLMRLCQQGDKDRGWGAPQQMNYWEEE